TRPFTARRRLRHYRHSRVVCRRGAAGATCLGGGPLGGRGAGAGCAQASDDLGRGGPHPAARVAQAGGQAVGGAVGILGKNPVRVDLFQSAFSGFAHGSFFVSKRNHQRFDRNRIAEGAQGLGGSQPHVAVRVGEQGEEGDGDVGIA